MRGRERRGLQEGGEGWADCEAAHPGRHTVADCRRAAYGPKREECNIHKPRHMRTLDAEVGWCEGRPRPAAALAGDPFRAWHGSWFCLPLLPEGLWAGRAAPAVVRRAHLGA